MIAFLDVRACRLAIVCLLLLLSPRPPAHAQSFSGDDSGHRIVQRPIPFGPERRALTLSYIRAHYDPQARDICIEPQMIVIHWTASPTLESALNEFHADTISPARARLRAAGKVNVSSQFLVDQDGAIYQLMPATWMARHTIGLNPIAIGIENVGGGSKPLTAQQLAADAWLVAHLKSQFRAIHYLIGHSEYARFRGTPLWRERDPHYFDVKPDPGNEFMQALRARVANLHLANSFDGYAPSPGKPAFSCGSDAR